MLLNIFYFIISLGAFQGLFMAALLLFMKSRTKTANRILACLFLNLAILLLIMVAIMADLLSVDSARPYLVPFLFLLGPCAFFYVKRYNYPEAAFKKKDLALLMPFVLTAMFYVPKYFSAFKIHFIDYNFFYDLFWHGVLVHFMLCILFSILTFRKGIKKTGKDSLSSGPVYSWLLFFHIFFVMSVIIAAAVTVDEDVRTYTRFNGIGLNDNVIAINALFLLYALSFKGLMHPAVFFGKHRSTGLIDDPGLSEEKIKSVMNKLNSVMEKEKFYLDPHLNLHKLSEITGIPRGHISKAINTCSNSNFYDYINAYRIMIVKNLLSENSRMNMIEIAYSSGFKSKSTFNDAFKRSTGITPTRYKNILQSGCKPE